MTDAERVLLEPHELQLKITQCRAATKAYREAFAKADELMKELKALGLCSKCSIDEHMQCSDYGCCCCGGGKCLILSASCWMYNSKTKGYNRGAAGV